MLIADGGGGVTRPTVVPVVTPTKQQPANNGESDAAARARELQRQLEALLERLREAQRRAEEARKRAIEAQDKAEKARKAAETARTLADKTRTATDEAAAKKSEQHYKLEDARSKKATADANLQDKDVALLKAQVAQKKEAKKSDDGKASPAADHKVQSAQDDRDAAQATSDRSKLYLDYQDKETRAQDAEAKVLTLSPTPGRPSYTITDDERNALSTAQTDANGLRTQANDAKSRFTDAVGTEAVTEFYGAPPEVQTGLSKAQTTELANDPLHSPLLQFLQVSPRPATGSTTAANTLLQPTFGTASPNAGLTGTGDTGSTAPLLLQPVKDLKPDPVVTPEVTKTLSSIADGKSVDQIAKDRGISVDQVISEAKTSGVQIEAGKPSGSTQQTTVKRGDASLTYTSDAEKKTVSVKGSFADPKAPGGHKTIEATRDDKGRYTQTVKDDKTGDVTTHTIDPQAGTRTDTVKHADGTGTETTTDLTGATVRRPVEEGEDYLDVAKAAGLTPEQLLALNPDIDYGKALKPGQDMVVSGVRTTVKTFNKDGTSLEVKTDSDGTRQASFVTASGRRINLMGKDDPASGPGEDIRKGLFDGKKSVADLAKSLGMTEEQVLKALPPGTVTVTEPSADNGGLRTRTIYDPVSNRTVVETYDMRRDHTSLQLIDDKTVFKVRQWDPKSGQYVTKEVAGGVGYAQKQADDKLALVGDYNQQIADLDKTIRYSKRMGESVTDLMDQRRDLVSQRDSAQGRADIAQGQATSTLLKRQQVQVDNMAANAYQRQSVARPGSKEQKEATQDLNDVLALADKVDRLGFSADKDIDYLKSALDKQQKHDAKVKADDTLQTEFEKWKNDVWMWQGIDPETAKKMKAEGQKPNTRIFADSKQENDAAWEAFVYQQKDYDKYGDKYITDAERPARDAWLARNRASDAETRSNGQFLDASKAKGETDAKVIQGDIDRLQSKKDDWVKAHPDDFSENFTDQKDLDQLHDDLTKLQVDGLLDGKDQQYNQYLLSLSAADREDPEALKEATAKFTKDHQKSNEEVDQKINDLVMAKTRNRAKVSETYIQQWAQRNPKLQEKLDALGTTSGTGSLRAAEHRMEERQKLLESSDQGKQLQSALKMKDETQSDLLRIGDDDVARVKKDLEGIDKTVEGQTWVRDIFSDKAEDTQSWTREQRDQAQKLRDDLASGKITLTEFTQKEDALMDSYGVRSVDLSQELQDSNETWAVVDDAIRMTATAAAGIGATLASGGNIAVGIGVGIAVNQLWDTGGDVVSALQGHDIYADGHSSIFSLGARALFNGGVTGDEVKFTLKDDAIDTATAAVNAFGVGAGMRTSAALTLKIAAREGLDLGAGATLKVGSRAMVGVKAGMVGQGVDGVGRIGVETLHVGLDGKLGTDEGSQRIGQTALSSGIGLLTSPLTGGISAAIPMNKVLGWGLGAQFVNDAAGSLGNAELISLATDQRNMNRAQFIAASLQAFPGTITNIALHPSMVKPPHEATRPSGAGFTADGLPKEPTSLNHASWEEVANHAGDYIQQQIDAGQPGATVRPLQPSADDAGALTWLQSEPQKGSGTVFVVSQLGPKDTIYGNNGGVRARNRDTYKTFAEASEAAQKQGGGWVNRVQPGQDHLPLRGRSSVGADEIVGAVHVNDKGESLPVGIPNMKHAGDLVDASGKPRWIGPTKAVLGKIPGPTKGLFTVLAVQGGAIAGKITGASWVYDTVTGGPYAAWVNQTRGLGTRAAYFTGKRGLENALEMARQGDAAGARRQIEIVANRRHLRGLSPDEITAKKQKALDQLGGFGDAVQQFHDRSKAAGVPADVTEAYPIRLASEAEIKAGTVQKLGNMEDGKLVSLVYQASSPGRTPKTLDAPSKLAQATDIYRQTQSGTPQGSRLSKTQRNQLNAFNRLQPDVRDRLVAAREAELGYQQAKKLVETDGNLINMKDVQGALGSTMHMGSPVGVTFKYGALVFAANSGMSGTYNFVKQLLHPVGADKPMFSALGNPAIKTLGLSGEVVGNVPNIAIQWNYLTGLLRRTKFSDAGADSKVPMADVTAYLNKRMGRMTWLRDSWWGGAEKLMTPGVKSKAARLNAEDKQKLDDYKLHGGDVPVRNLTLSKYILSRRTQADDRVKALDAALKSGKDLDQRSMAKTESELAAKSMNTASDFMSIPSMFRYSMMALIAPNPALAGVTAFHGIVSNGGWLRSQQGKGTIYGFKMAPSGLYEGNGLFGVGKRFGRGYNWLVDKTAAGIDRLPLVGNRVNTDKMAKTLKLGPTVEDAANRRRMRLLLTGATTPTLNLLVALLGKDDKKEPPVQALATPQMPSTLTVGRNQVANEALSQLLNLDPRFDSEVTNGVQVGLQSHPEAQTADWRVQVAG